MAPDFIYFIRFAPRGHFGHTLPGLFLFCLPVGLAVWWVFHHWLKKPLLHLAPVALQRRAVGMVGLPTRHILQTVVAILIGAATHVLWDAFTHEQGFGVAAVPALQRFVPMPLVGNVALYKIAQHGSTLVGFMLLAVWLGHWWKKAPAREVRPVLSAAKRAVRLAVLGVSSFLVALGYAAQATSQTNRPGQAFVGYFVVAWISTAFVAVVGYAVWLYALSRRA